MQGYIIRVGTKSPAKAIVAVPDKDTGLPTGDQTEVFRSVGSHNLLNRARVWARRVKPDGLLPTENGVERSLEVTDKEYKGDLEFLDWGDNKVGAQALEIRFLDQSSSLDYDYQRTVQRIETKVEDGSDYILLNPGENKFDQEKEKRKVQFLRVHPGNFNSKSKNPNPQIKGFVYKEVTVKDENVAYVAHKESSLEAGLFVKGLATDDKKIANLFEIFEGYGLTFGDVNYLSSPTDKYKALLNATEVDPEGFFKLVSRYKKELYDKFQYADSFRALDLSKEGNIGLSVNGKVNLVFQNVPEKGKKMIDWVTENFADPVVFEKIKHFNSLCEKLK
ncbi:MAG: hypothetical protein KDC56_04420 [Flavobacteriaceae bacterium]|nr:hypothetical protein [Flavobacteriaceae bacterium]